MEEQKEVTAVLKKLHAIMSDVGVIGKDRTNKLGGGYDYASEYAIKTTLQPLLIKHGVIHTVAVAGSEMVKLQGQDRNGADNYKTEIVTIHTFWDVDTGQHITFRFGGTGNGRDDKGFYAAITGAIKYAFTSTFAIPTGDDPEDEGNEVPKDKKPAAKPKPKPKPKPAAKPAVKAAAKPATEPVVEPEVETAGGFRPTIPADDPAKEAADMPTNEEIGFTPGIFGRPKDGEEKISADQARKITGFFGKLGVTPPHVKFVSGALPEDWTPTMVNGLREMKEELVRESKGEDSVKNYLYKKYAVMFGRPTTSA